MKRYPSTKAIVALTALVALIGSIAVFTVEAAPVTNGIGVAGYKVKSQDQVQQQQQEVAAIIDNVAPRIYKRQNPTHTETRASTTEAPRTSTTHTNNPPTTTSAPSKSTTRPAATNPATRPSATTTAHGSSSTTPGTSGTGTATSTGTGTGAVPSSSPTGGSNDNNVPTKVSEKVFIGLGTVGGFFVFALGGLAFCRHRKKKNLASALLQQTAQFNNNNPYAKLPEPAASPKESLPMTPTKPLGTYNVVATYTPALADEIEIGLGDSVTILQEFDDGWCMGVNNTRGGAKGVFPRHCVEMGSYEGSQHGAPGGPHYPPSPSFKAAANKRISSIAPGGGWNAGYSNDGGYPPQPSPQYLNANQGPPHNGGGFYNGGGY